MERGEGEKTFDDEGPLSFSSPSTDSLLEPIERGDTIAFGRYLEECKPALLAHIQRRMGPALRKVIEPEDIYQEVSLSAIRALSGVNLVGRDPFPWLCELAGRRIVDAHRYHYQASKRDRNREVGLQDGRSDGSKAVLLDILALSVTTASQACFRNQRHRKLHAMIESLPSHQRDALRLRYLEGRSTREIAERLGKKDGAIRVLISRTLRKMFDEIGVDFAP